MSPRADASPKQRHVRLSSKVTYAKHGLNNIRSQFGSSFAPSYTQVKPAHLPLATMALDGDLKRLLQKFAVDGRVETYLVDKNVLTIIKFAALADDKADVADGICVPAGLDKTDRPLCGPVKSAWAEAEALATASLVSIKRGKVCDLDDPVDPDVRTKNTTDFVGHYHLKLPAQLIGSDTLMGRLVREYERKVPTAFDIRKVKSLAYLASEPGEKFMFTCLPGGDLSGAMVDADDDTPLNVYSFMYKHKVLMNSMAWAVAPNWGDADWSALLEYHEWVMLKLFERKKGRPPLVSAVREADHQMRTKWVEKQRQDGLTTTQAVIACKSEYAHIFSDVHGQTPDNAGTNNESGKRPPKAARTGTVRSDKDSKQDGRAATNSSVQICKFYNQNKCSYGSRCKNAHICNVQGCHKAHPACDNHAKR